MGETWPRVLTGAGDAAAAGAAWSVTGGGVVDPPASETAGVAGSVTFGAGAGDSAGVMASEMRLNSRVGDMCFLWFYVWFVLRRLVTV